MKNISISILFFLASYIGIGLSAQTIDSIPIHEGILYYKVFGEGKPLLFLNGGPGFSSDGYEYIAEHLEGHRQVILFDQRGTGKSKIKGVNSLTVNIHIMVNDIERLRKHLNISTWDVMGHSFGGEYARFYAVKYPDRINKLILTATTGKLKKRGKRIAKFKKVDEDELLPIEKEFIEIIKDTSFNDREEKYKMRIALGARYYVHKKENITAAINFFYNTSKYYWQINRYVHKSIKKENIQKQLKKYNKPVLIIYPRHDIIDIKAPLNLMKIFPNARMEIIEDCGHLLWLEEPEKTKKLVLDFLGE